MALNVASLIASVFGDFAIIGAAMAVAIMALISVGSLIVSVILDRIGGL